MNTVEYVCFSFQIIKNQQKREEDYHIKMFSVPRISRKNIGIIIYVPSLIFMYFVGNSFKSYPVCQHHFMLPPTTKSKLDIINVVNTQGVRLIKFPNCTNNFALVILVQSHVLHFSNRNLIRNTWGKRPPSEQSKWNIFFLVAQPKEERSLLLVNREFEEFNDLVIGDTIENFYALHLKLQFGFIWSIMHCEFQYLLKADDDTYVNIPGLFRFLRDESTPKINLYAGNVLLANSVDRSGRYGLSKGEYKRNIFPRYCSGGGFVLSADVVIKMIKNFSKVPPMRIDDVYIGELALAGGIDPFHSDKFQMYSKCVYNNERIVYHPVKEKHCIEKHLFEKYSVVRNKTNKWT